MQYNYDDSGATFNFFLLTILMVLLVPYTISVFFSGKDSDLQLLDPIETSEERKNLLKKEASSLEKYKTPLILIIGWLLLFFAAYNAATTDTQIKDWDPYQILGLDIGATKEQAKKAYKKLSMKYHPDRVLDDAKKPAAEAMFVDVSKAYKVMTDDVSRENWEKYGHPDGKQEYHTGIALPSWLVDKKNSFFVLSIYGLVLGVFLPYLVHKWWTGHKRYTRDKILNNTMALYYKELKEVMPMRVLVEILAASLEFSEQIPWRHGEEEKLTKLMNEVRKVCDEKGMEKVEKSKKFPAKYCFKSLTLLMAHFHRVPVEDADLKKDQYVILVTSLHLINGMLQITTAQSWLSTTMMCIDMFQMLVRAIAHQESPMLQLPNITQGMLKHFKTKKRNIRTPSQFLELNDEEKRALFRSLSDDEYNETLLASKNHPILELNKIQFKVGDEDVITPQSLVTLVIDFTYTSFDLKSKKSNDSALADHEDDDLFDDNDNEDDIVIGRKAKKYLFKEKDRSQSIVTPYFPVEKRPLCWVILCDLRTNRLITLPIKVGNLCGRRITRLKFPAPPSPGTYPLSVFVRSDSTIGIDLKIDLKLVVQEPVAADEIPEDDISEPEVDTLAGQMAAMKKDQATGKEQDDASDFTTDSEAED